MQRPTSVTVFGVLNIVFAVFGILGVLGSVVMFLPQMANSDNPMIKIINNNPGYAMWLKANIPLGLAACGALLAAGIGLLKLRPWARQLAIAYAIYAIVMSLVSSVVNYFYIVQPMLAEAHDKSGPETGAAIGGAIGSLFGGCFGMIYPVLLLIFMFRANVKEVFGAGPQPPPI